MQLHRRNGQGFLGRLSACLERDVCPDRIFKALRNAVAPTSHPCLEGPLELMTMRACSTVSPNFAANSGGLYVSCQLSIDLVKGGLPAIL